MKKQWKLDNKGMTLLEVIVAFAIFAIAATILITGFNGALKVMGNSEKIKNASQENTGKLNAVGASALEEFEGLKDSEITENDGVLKLKFEKVYSVPGTFYTATSKEKTDMDMKMFQPDGSNLVVPLVTVPKKADDKKDDEEVAEWEEMANKKDYFIGDKVWYGEPKEYYICIQDLTWGSNLLPPNNLNMAAHWNRINSPDGTALKWDINTRYAKGTIVEFNSIKYESQTNGNFGQQPPATEIYWKVKQ